MLRQLSYDLCILGNSAYHSKLPLLVQQAMILLAWKVKVVAGNINLSFAGFIGLVIILAKFVWFSEEHDDIVFIFLNTC